MRQESVVSTEPHETPTYPQQQPHLSYLLQDFQKHAFPETPYGQAQCNLPVRMPCLPQEIQIQEQHARTSSETHPREEI